MKCELCHKKDAETAIQAVKDGVEQELYVCRECEREERVRRQKKSQRTRKAKKGLPPGVSMTVASSGGDGAPPPLLEAIVNAFTGMVEDMASAAKSREKEPELSEFPLSRVPSVFRLGDALHLEGLYLIGEIEAVRRALNALGMRLSGINADGISDAGHVYKVMYQGPAARAKRVVEDILAQERNARVRLFEEMPRVFGDSLCRALAVLKNCRLLSKAEYFDLLSPLRLAALEKMLDGLSRAEIERIITGLDLTPKTEAPTAEERDRVDAERADEVNGRFEDVVLNERGEEKFL
ncbi:MAG: hypothetical protein K6F50_05580 [Kiritimatiellae bacterium]|nr:hypothetical protein [Kiritimatiellia bacterium]